MHQAAAPELNVNTVCNCLAARKASRYLTAAYDQALAGAGLRTTQFSILHHLATSGPLAIGELATIMAMDRTTLSTNLKPLQREALLSMAPGVDRRAKMAQISKAGLARYRQAIPLWQEVQAQFETSYGVKRAVDLRQALQAVLQSGFEPWAERTT